MAKYKRMTPAEFAQWIRKNLKHGEYVAFALDENRYEVSDDSSLAAGNADLQCWWCATIVKSEGYDFNVMLINYAGGGQPYAIEIDDSFEEMLSYYFENINYDYDDHHKIVIETRYRARARAKSSVRNSISVCFAYADTIEKAKTLAIRMLNNLCKSRNFPKGECEVNLEVTQDDEYIDSDEGFAEWDGKEIKFNVEEM